MPDATSPISDLKISGVEAIYLRLPQVKAQCDSGQDALIVRVTTDAGITGYSEVDSAPTLRHHISEPIKAVDGRVAVPDAPGLGLEMNEEGIQKYRVG